MKDYISDYYLILKQEWISKRLLHAIELFYRLTMHEAHRPSYPEWVLTPDPVQEVVWEQLWTVVSTRDNQPSHIS